MFTESEQEMWSDPVPEEKLRLKDHEIDEKYERGEDRIVTESNREKLPNFVQAMKNPGYMDVRPFYQRRARWDPKKQSKLIESFIMNVPVPPVFLYEKKFNQYEVMDGQQRITAIKEFYDNKLKLVGLESWSELNGRTYLTLPTKVKAGVDRRSLSSIVLMKESAPDEETDWLLKRMVFERLNTGGQKLSQQEIRNCLYYGELNKRLLKLAEYPAFRQIWGIPDLPVPEGEEPPSQLANDQYFKDMGDAQLVLRFFALRHWERFRGAMQDFLDRYMIRSKKFNAEDYQKLDKLFKETIDTCKEVFGDLVFRPYEPDNDEWGAKPQASFADSVMVAISDQLMNKEKLLGKKRELINGTQRLFQENPAKTFTGAANTRNDVQNRIKLYCDMVNSIVQD